MIEYTTIGISEFVNSVSMRQVVIGNPAFGVDKGDKIGIVSRIENDVEQEM